MKTLKFKDYLVSKILYFSKIIGVREKKLSEIQETDFEEGHEKYKSQEDMLAHYRDYYGDKVDINSVIKIVKFRLIKNL